MEGYFIMDFKKLYIEHAVYPAMTLLQHNRVTAYTKALQATETQDPAQRTAVQRQRLSELLYLCRQQIPAYSDLPFTDLELRREAMDCLQAVDPLPMADFLAEAQQHLRRGADKARLLCCHYGTGGQAPAELYLTQEQVEWYEAARWRGLSWYGVSYGSRSVLLWDRPRDPFFLQEEPYLKNRLRISVCAMTARSVQPTVEAIDEFHPEYLSGSASGLAALAEHMQRSSIRLQTAMKVVTVTQGVADEALRQQLSQVFGCPVAQTFGVRPEGIIAYMCPEGHLHVTAENCYVELIDPHTWTTAAPDRPGLVTVTGLCNEIMPHLRVVLDYMARWSNTPCPCGRTLPVLEDLRQTAPSE